MADPDEALIEAIAEAILTAYLPVRERFTPWKAASAVSDEQRQTARTYARAAYAAMVEHLGLTEQWGTDDQTDDHEWADEQVDEASARHIAGGDQYLTVVRRLVSRWVEVDHGSE